MKRLLRWVIALCVFLALGFAVWRTGCMLDNRCLPVAQVDDVAHEELVGTWLGWEGSSVTLHEGGEAEFHLLDGDQMDFHDGWRATGTGEWEVYETDHIGPRVRLTLLESTGVEHAPAGSPHRSPVSDRWIRDDLEGYPWDFGLDRKEGDLRMYLYISNEDLRSYNWFHRA